MTHTSHVYPSSASQVQWLSLLPAVQEQLGLSFVPIQFVPDERPSSEQLSKLTSTRKVASARHLVRLADLCLCAL